LSRKQRAKLHAASKKDRKKSGMRGDSEPIRRNSSRPGSARARPIV